MITVKLYGRLAEELGDEFSLSVRTVAEAIRALECNFPKRVYPLLRNGVYSIIRGADVNTEIEHLYLGEEELEIFLPPEETIHIVPLPEGAKGGFFKSIAKVVVGAALIYVAVQTGGIGLAGGSFFTGGTGAFMAEAAGGIFLSQSTIALFGVSLILGGVTEMMAPQPKVDMQGYQLREPESTKPSFLSNGPVNVTEQGNPVPLVYGRIWAGSVIVSGGVETVDLDANWEPV